MPFFGPCCKTNKCTTTPPLPIDDPHRNVTFASGRALATSFSSQTSLDTTTSTSPNNHTPSLHLSSVTGTSLPLMAAAAASISPSKTNDSTLPDPEHATEFTSIRRRYTDLTKGPAAEIDLVFSHHATLFQQTFEVEWVEDSPGFRHKLAAVDENVEGLRKHMLRLVAICRQYCEAGQVFSDIGRNFAAEMMHLQDTESWFTRLGDLAPALIRFGETLDEIQNYREALLISLETTFSQPLEAFLKREVKEVKKKRIELQSSLVEYENNLSKFLALKNNDKDDVVEMHETIVAASKRRFELNR